MTNLFVPAQYTWEIPGFEVNSPKLKQFNNEMYFKASCGDAGLSKFCAILSNGSVVRAPTNAKRAFLFPMCTGANYDGQF